MSSPSGKKAWRNSEAQRILNEGFLQGDIPLDADPLALYQSRSEFQDFPFSQFRDRLRYLRKKIKESKDVSAADYAALISDRKNHPVQSLVTFSNKRRWEGSDAESLLRSDVSKNIDRTMQPIDLWRSRPEYHKFFPLKVFRKHIDQERETTKYYNQRRARSGK
jgi:hypothetical protein